MPRIHYGRRIGSYTKWPTRAKEATWARIFWNFLNHRPGPSRFFDPGQTIIESLSPVCLLNTVFKKFYCTNCCPYVPKKPKDF